MTPITSAQHQARSPHCAAARAVQALRRRRLQQLRRAGLHVGQSIDLPVAWIDVDLAAVVELPQRYERIGPHEYAYEDRIRLPAPPTSPIAGHSRSDYSAPGTRMPAARPSMTTFALIPGAGGAAWYWHRVLPLLERAGHAALAVDLPGDDDRAGLHAYADVVMAALGKRRDIALVAQSMGGFTAALVCARARPRIHTLGGHLVALSRPRELAKVLLACIAR